MLFDPCENRKTQSTSTRNLEAAMLQRAKYIFFSQTMMNQIRDHSDFANGITLEILADAFFFTNGGVPRYRTAKFSELSNSIGAVIRPCLGYSHLDIFSLDC